MCSDIIIILFCQFYLSQNGFIDTWTPRDCHFAWKIKAILKKILNLGFWNFRSTFLKSVISSCNTFSVFKVICLCWYLHLLTFGDKGVRVLAGPFLGLKIRCYSIAFSYPSFCWWFCYIISCWLRSLGLKINRNSVIHLQIFVKSW